MEFPRDLNHLIVSKLDIDTRRTLGIYTKLKCPSDLEQKISKTLNKVHSQYDHFCVELGPKRDPYMHMYTLIRFFDSSGMWDNRVDYVSTGETTKVYVFPLEL